MTASSGANPLATVVITTHDRPEFVQRALRSALAQTIRDIEVVVVDDGSGVPFVPAVHDMRVRVLRNDRALGVCAARNIGIGSARGDWITFLDDDDVLSPDMLRRSIAAAERSELPRPVAAMSAVVVLGLADDESEVVLPATELRRGEHYFLEGRGGSGRVANTLVAPTELMRSIGGFDEELRAFQHDDLGLRLNAVASIQGIDDPQYRMTTHREPRLSAGSSIIPSDMERTLAKHWDVFRRHRIAHAHFMATTGMYHLKAGNWGPAVRWCLRALRVDPCQRRVWLFTAAALAGPRVREVYHRLRRPEAGLSAWTLARRRLRKYSRRVANYPRGLAALPLARMTTAIIRRRGLLSSTNASRRVLVLSVYRARNAAHVAALVGEARARGWDVRLWALDRADPALASHTIGTSSGAKFPLLNELLNGQDLDRWDWIVVADDDFAFRCGSIADLLAVSEAADLDLVQPAHTELSHRDNDITVRRPFSVARRTSYVENGPVFAVRRPWTSKLLPFPEKHTMGWGLELEWFDMMASGARLGIVDAVALRHLRPVGKAYPKQIEGDRLRELVRGRGLESFRDIQHTLQTWRAWQARPPWQQHD